jgi:hypothetical protein
MMTLIVTMVEIALQVHGFKVSAFTDPAMALEQFKVNCKDYAMILYLQEIKAANLQISRNELSF